MSGFDEIKNKKLYRSQSNRMIGGVCGGFAEYFSIDPTIVRLIWIAITFFGGLGIVIYIASLIIIPANPDQSPADASQKLIRDKNLFWGSLLIIIGIFLVLKQMGMFYTFSFLHLPWQYVWAFAFITVGLILIYNRVQENDSVEGSVDPNKKKLYRSRSQKMIAGVCGGLAQYFEMDVSVMRVLWVIGIIMSFGFGVFAYIVMVIMFPEEPAQIDDKSITT